MAVILSDQRTPSLGRGDKPGRMELITFDTAAPAGLTAIFGLLMALSNNNLDRVHLRQLIISSHVAWGIIGASDIDLFGKEVTLRLGRSRSKLTDEDIRHVSTTSLASQ